MTEAEVMLAELTKMLRVVLADGGRKVAAGRKTPWWCDGGHEVAMWRHMAQWKSRRLVDPDSLSHPLVHVAARALAIAYQETKGRVDPTPLDSAERLDRARGR